MDGHTTDVKKDENCQFRKTKMLRTTFHLNQCRVSKLNDCRLTLMAFWLVLNVR
jgi:hypothetical protein